MKKSMPDMSRRSLLKKLTVGGAAGVAIAAAGIPAVQANEAKTNTPSKDGYHETAHIRAYYNSLRS
ncbi:Fnr-inducible formate dehydrogenase accessory protein FdhX [Shewanella sp. NFH-SH190041]|uniref:twin-arginine translocation signal domain-containing protein n=1 Tax=Shewanella sp. NFH-SH190041 TaxID=2950245 RepID=UPI0021C41B90|nr:twin-arginine translocation signal domain-containing protein [Shewanella sp. NFH-SH190041]BDM62597.1 Fnr-inducible formate dehydrogenase accessory protein FdhX [Shewanella sp. NFH-SH190041]